MLKKLKQIYNENKKAVNRETMYIEPDKRKDLGDIIHVFDRFGLKILGVEYENPNERTNYKAAITFIVSGTIKHLDMYEAYMYENYKTFRLNEK